MKNKWKQSPLSPYRSAQERSKISSMRAELAFHLRQHRFLTYREVGLILNISSQRAIQLTKKGKSYNGCDNF